MRIVAAAGEDASRPCDHDREMLQVLLGAEVRVLDRDEVPYDFRCGYEVQST
jgi:hypothetical protein